MLIDCVFDRITAKNNPCIVGLDPVWARLPHCYTAGAADPADALLRWGKDVIDSVADLAPAVKPQMAFFEVFGGAGVEVFAKLTAHAHARGLFVIDDSKRGDIGSTAQAYAEAHLAPDGPIGADFLTVSPFLGTDSLAPFLGAAARYDRGLFILVKTSNPSSHELSGARTEGGETIRDWLAGVVSEAGRGRIGTCGFSPIGAVVGATYPEEAVHLRRAMPRSLFLVPGFGAQGGRPADIACCFAEGRGALVSASRSIIYPDGALDASRTAYCDLVRAQTIAMRDAVKEAIL